jgi:hypothetical protein
MKELKIITIYSMKTTNEILDLYMNASRTLAIAFFRYIYDDESI